MEALMMKDAAQPEHAANDNSKRESREESSRVITYDFIKDMTSRLKAIEDIVTPSEKPVAQGTEPAEAENRPRPVTPSGKMVAEVRDCNWEQFKNRFSVDEAVYTIETLSALDSDDLDDQMEREQIARIPKHWRDDFESERQRVRWRNPSMEDMLEAEFLSLEQNLATNTDSAELNPPPLFQDILKQGREETNVPAGTDDSSSTEHQKEDESEHTMLEHIKCYIDFARTKLKGPFHAFDDLDFLGRPKIRYQDLSSLFRIGELAFEEIDKNNAQSENNGKPGSTQHAGPPRLLVWRVMAIEPETVDWVVYNPQRPSYLRRNAKMDMDKQDKFKVLGYQLDWNGDSFAPEDASFWFDRYEGEKEVSKLSLFPARFHPEHKALLSRLSARGDRFQEFLKNSHLAMSYDGWTLTVKPFGWLIKDEDGKDQGAEYISSDVIIDFKEAVCAHPSWEPDFVEFGLNKTRILPMAKQKDCFPLVWWIDGERSGSWKQLNDIVVVDDAITSVQWANLATTDDFLFDEEVRAVERQGANEKLTADDLALLPERIFAYSLKDRKFINGNINCMREPKQMSDPFGELQIPERHKRLIRATVQDHLERKRVERELIGQGRECLEQDFIRTGKTATAEAVAYSHSKPLYSLGCGDLGTGPSTVESNLSEIFRLANLWDCVLLLDEADIFLSHRAKKDDNLQRNALVSIFLRTMEYYPGLLFLTTNRAGALDEALSSRVHVSINFPDLNRDQTMALFRMNIRRPKRNAEQRASIPGQPKLEINTDEIEEF
ncbi:hypothetical protein QBC37DRAFT_379361, partial [Rhypophila decipiens]